MRLIDADEMKDELKDMDFVLTKHNVEDWIDEQPTVDAGPVRHGKWQPMNERNEIYGDVYMCDNCGHGFVICENFHYCPNCGAKMDLEGDNG